MRVGLRAIGADAVQGTSVCVSDGVGVCTVQSVQCVCECVQHSPQFVTFVSIAFVVRTKELHTSARPLAN